MIKKTSFYSLNFNILRTQINITLIVLINTIIKLCDFNIIISNQIYINICSSISMITFSIHTPGKVIIFTPTS